MLNRNKTQSDLFKAEKGTIPATFRLQKNLIKMMEVFSDRYRVNKTDIITLAVYNYLKDKFDDDYEPLKQFKELNEEDILIFEKNLKEI